MTSLKIAFSVLLGILAGYFLRDLALNETNSEVTSRDTVNEAQQASSWRDVNDQSVFSSSESGLAPGLYYARMFDGLVVLPNRYYLSEVFADRVILSSNPLIGEGGDFLAGRDDLPTDQAGHIVFGKFSDANSDTDAMEATISSNADAISNCFGFNQIVIQLSIASTPGTLTQGFFYDDDSYVSVVDGNAELWRSMLVDFERNADPQEVGCLDNVAVKQLEP